MSCSCGYSPCNCQPRPSVCCTPTTESVEYTYENGNLVGVGVFDNDTDNLVQFRGAVSNSAALTITLDAGNKAIVFDFDSDALVLDIPDADTTTRGILETATNAEAQAKAATNKILVPSNLAALGSTTSFAGLVELATDAETVTGTSTTLAVTPSGVTAAISLVGTTTWADEVERLGAEPDFFGQIGTQLDTGIPFVATGTNPGDFNDPLFVLQNANNVIETVTTTVDLIDSSLLLFQSSDLTGRVNFGCDVDLQSGFTLSMGGDIDFNGGSIQISGVTVPANSVITTSAFGGQPSSALIATFISTANKQTGWGTPSGTLARTTFATYAGQTISNPPTQAEVQALDDALVIVSRRLGALITDLLAVKLPAT